MTGAPIEFGALDTRVVIDVEPPRMRSALEALTRLYAPQQPTRQALVYRLDARDDYALYRNDELIYRTSCADDVVPTFELDLYRTLLQLCVEPLVLHAATLQRGDGAIVLCGPSGVGKSTLAQALVARGAQYLGDEWTLVGTDGRVRGLNRPIVLDGALGEPVISSRLESLGYRVRRWDGSWQELRLIYPRLDQVCSKASQVSAVVLLQPPGATPVELRALAPHEALPGLTLSTMRSRPGAAEALTALLATAQVYSLRGSTVESTTATIDALWRLVP